jgi:16S rRNA (adenine(1408)-N(1))-methyltransferase
MEAVMEVIRGKRVMMLEAAALAEALSGYDEVHMDIGTGDGRFARYMAQECPRWLVIGVDACRENLYAGSRRAPANTLFVIANAQALPPGLNGLAGQVTINFPWGSLLGGLLEHDSDVVAGLRRVMRPGGRVEIRLNAGALAEAGWSLEDGADQVRDVLAASGFAMRSALVMPAGELKRLPTTWAKRLAFGRDPRAICLAGVQRSSGGW